MKSLITLKPNAKVPVKAHTTDLAYDVTASSRIINFPLSVTYKTGLALQLNWYGWLGFARSNVRNRYMSLATSVGLIDEPYTGDIEFTFYTNWITWLPWIRKEKGKWKFSWNRLYKSGERIGQILPFATPSQIDFEIVETLNETERGDNGHGSTGF